MQIYSLVVLFLKQFFKRNVPPFGAVMIKFFPDLQFFNIKKCGKRKLYFTFTYYKPITPFIPYGHYSQQLIK